jgi:hypothetical protein
MGQGKFCSNHVLSLFRNIGSFGRLHFILGTEVVVGVNREKILQNQEICHANTKEKSLLYNTHYTEAVELYPCILCVHVLYGSNFSLGRSSNFQSTTSLTN